MAATPTRFKNLLKRFRARKVMTLAELAAHMRCSQRTVHRRLKDWQAINSYNKNGRYYALPDVPEFDSHGLWHYRDIAFSRYGNLTETVIQLVRNSQAGLTSAELGQQLRVESRSFLWQFRNHPALKRDRQEGRFVYFSAESEMYRRQKSKRVAMAASANLPSDTQAIAILVGTVKHPQLSIGQLCARLKRQRVAVSEQDIMNLFTHHGLAVKKTQRSSS